METITLSEDWEDQTGNIDDFHLPRWAIGWAHGVYHLGAQLPTRDGRRTGNAHIIAIEDSDYVEGEMVYTVLTDAGNQMELYADEVSELFHHPKYVSRLSEVLSRFYREV